jgi:hypothetical protein
VRFGTAELSVACDVSGAGPGCSQGASCFGPAAAEASMIVRPFRFIAPALAALGLVALRLASPLIGPATPPPGTAEEGRVVFRHYL